MKHNALILALILVLTWSWRSAAWAQVPEAEKDFRSPQHFLFEMKFGPYAPQIDSEFDDAATPFRDLFGDGKALMMSGEFDVELWRRFGTVAIGGSLGYYKNETNALLDTNSTDTIPSNSTTRSAGVTSITLLPLALLAIYRFDWPTERWNFPLVPFAKLGLNYTLWWVNKGDGSTAEFAGEKATGGTLGWQFNGGASLLLDVLDPQSAKTLDLELGINHTYLFFEFIMTKGFGPSNALHVGDTTWNAGIAFEF